MPRINIYKVTETPYFHYHNQNPKGKNASDCVYRAISKALDQDYATTMREMTECALSIGYAPNENKTIKKYLESKSWVTYKEPRDLDNKKVLAKTFCSLHPRESFVALVGSHHCTYIRDGQVWDTWDCSGKPVHTYWRKRK